MENEKKFKFIKGCDDCPFFCYDMDDEVYSCLIENKIFNKNKNKLFEKCSLKTFDYVFKIENML